MEKLFSPSLYVAPSSMSNAGRGVFAAKDIKKGDIIERSPILYLPENDTDHINETHLMMYIYYLGKKKDRLALLLGYGSLYNHSDTPKASYKEYQEEAFMEYIALQDIVKGEEITVHYNQADKSVAPLWFE